MSLFSEPTPEPGPERGAPHDDDLHADHPDGRPAPARAHLAGLHLDPDVDPGLLDLARSGWRLDRLPTTSLAVAFVLTLFTTLLAFGAMAALPVAVTAVVSVSLAGAALAVEDVGAARAALVTTRAVLVAWTLLTVLSL